MHMLLAKSIFVCLMPIKYLYCIVVLYLGLVYAKAFRRKTNVSFEQYETEHNKLMSRGMLRPAKPLTSLLIRAV